MSDSEDLGSPSTHAIDEANRDHAKFSGHGRAIGAAGYKPESRGPVETLNGQGDFSVVDPQTHAYGEIRLGLAWDNVRVENKNALAAAVGKARGVGVDLDLGVLYELKTGERGSVQAFGKFFGGFEQAPYIALSGDERTGDAPGDDEFIRINGAKWHEISRVLIYAYIYEGVASWADVRPKIRISVPGERDRIAVPSISDSSLPICAVAGLENVRDGIKIVNYGEFFTGHIEMDRAFGFGIAWEDGQKDDGAANDDAENKDTAPGLRQSA